MAGQGYYTTGYGSAFIMTKLFDGPNGSGGAVSTDFNPADNSFAHNVGGDTSYGCWDHLDLEGTGTWICRHGGLINDGYDNQGAQWMFTLNPADRRFMNDGADKYTQVYFREDPAKYASVGAGCPTNACIQAAFNALTLPPAGSCLHAMKRAVGMGTTVQSGTTKLDVNNRLITTYCDQTTAGGGWTLVSKIRAGNVNGFSKADWVARIADGTRDWAAGELTNGNNLGSEEFAQFDAATMNANMDTNTVVMVKTTWGGASQNNGTFLMKKMTGAAVDLWSAIRNNDAWSPGNAMAGQGYYTTGYGSDFIMTKIFAGPNGSGGAVSTDLNPADNSFAHNVGGDSSYGCWDHLDLEGTGTWICRHGGLINDGYDNQGAQWMFTLNPADSRFMNDGADKYTQVYYREDPAKYKTNPPTMPP